MAKHARLFRLGAALVLFVCPVLSFAETAEGLHYSYEDGMTLGPNKTFWQVQGYQVPDQVLKQGLIQGKWKYKFVPGHAAQHYLVWSTSNATSYSLGPKDHGKTCEFLDDRTVGISNGDDLGIESVHFDSHEKADTFTHILISKEPVQLWFYRQDDDRFGLVELNFGRYDSKEVKIYASETKKWEPLNEYLSKRTQTGGEKLFEKFASSLNSAMTRGMSDLSVNRQTVSKDIQPETSPSILQPKEYHLTVGAE